MQKVVGMLGMCLLFIISCSEFTDEAPTLVSYELSLDSIENTITALDTLVFRAELTDDVSLASYTISILPVNPSILPSTSSLVDFVIQENSPIAGKRLKAFNSYPLLASTRAGAYTFAFSFTDEAGFLGEEINQSFTLINKAPEIRLDSLLSDSLTLSSGDILSVSGRAFGEFAEMDSLRILLFQETDSSSIFLLNESRTVTTNPFPFSTSYQFQVQDTSIFQFSIQLTDKDSLGGSIAAKICVNP
ncbi:MAG: hypothetical protein AAF824_13555 [Bacteroidota bacterium]